MKFYFLLCFFLVGCSQHKVVSDEVYIVRQPVEGGYCYFEWNVSKGTYMPVQAGPYNQHCYRVKKQPPLWEIGY